jgi:hypothetical protein
VACHLCRLRLPHEIGDAAAWRDRSSFQRAGKRLSADRLIIPDALLALSAATAIEPQVETWRKQPLRRPFSSALQLIGCDI